MVLPANPLTLPLLALPTAPSLTRRALGKTKSIGIKEGGDGSPPLSPSMRRKVREEGTKSNEEGVLLCVCVSRAETWQCHILKCTQEVDNK